MEVIIVAGMVVENIRKVVSSRLVGGSRDSLRWGLGELSGVINLGHTDLYAFVKIPVKLKLKLKKLI